MIEKMRLNAQQQTTTDNQGWTMNTIKQHNKSKKHITKNVSSRYVPIRLPPFESTVYEDSDTKYKIPITITIKSRRKEQQYGFKDARFLVAMINAFQMAHQDTYIDTINDNKATNKIAHHTQVPTNENNIKKFMLETVTGQNNILNQNNFTC
jgi:hypothetical protein